MDDQISRDNLKLFGVVLASGFNMIIFVMYRDKQIIEKGSEQIFKYIRKTKVSSNEYANIFDRLKSHRTNILIYLR